MKKRTILILSLIFLLFIGVMAFSWQRMSFSKQILKVEILGPDRATVGDSIEYVVKVKNNGSVRLQNPELIWEYPDNSILDSGQAKIKTMSSGDLGGDIYPGEERTFKFDTRLLGKENDTKTAKASVSFQPENLKSRSEVSTTFTTILGSIPLALSIDVPDQAEGGKALTLKVNYSSNVAYPLQDLTCYVDYPGDFDFLYSQPQGLGNTQWDIPILNESGSGMIQISGILNGQSMAQKVFKARIGIWQDGSFIVLKEVVKGVQVVAPSVLITQTINNDPSYVATAGDQLHYQITFRNVGETALTNLTLIARLEGSGLNLSSIKAPEGTHQAGDNSIVWDGSQVPELKYLDPGQVGTVEYWVNIDPKWSMKTLADKNPIVRNRITISGASQDFLTKINSFLGASQSIYSGIKYFNNAGPYPLQTNQKTYLTVEWKASNYYNDVEGAKMTTVLPDNVTYEGKTYPDGVNITYNPDTSEVTCDIGGLPAGSGVISDPKICAFQISVQPQITTQPIFILGATQLSGVDQWTSKQLTVKTDNVYGDVAQ